MSIHRNQWIGWREPFHARARVARQYLRRRWYIFVGSGGSLAGLATLLFVIYAHELDEPLPWRAIGLVVIMGAVVSALLTMNLFLPQRIRLKESSIVLSYPRGLDWIRYATLRRCHVTSDPDPIFQGIGEASQVLFQIFLDPRVDREHLRTFLAAKGLKLDVAAQD